MLGFQALKKISDSILEKKWSRNNLIAEDDPYEALVFVYNKEMDQVMVANITSS